MSNKLFVAGLKEISTGLMPGLNEDTVPLWANGRNVIFDQYGARPAPGYGDIDLLVGLFDDQPGMFDDSPGLFDSLTTGVSISPSVGESIRGLATSQETNGQRKFFYATLSKIYVNSGTEVNASRPGGYAGREDAVPGKDATYWSFHEWGEWMLATNGNDPPQIYKPTPGTFNDIPDIQCTWAQIVFALGPYAVLANTSNGLNTIEWSAQDNPEQWDFSTYTTAGRRAIRSFIGPIIAYAPLGKGGLLYGETQAHAIQLGGPFTFSTVPAVQGIGAVSKASVVSRGNLNMGIMRDGIFETDGVTYTWRSYPMFGRWLQDNVNWEQKSKIVGWHDSEWSTIRWAVPIKPSNINNLVIVYNYTTGAFALESTAFSSGVERGRLGTPLVGTDQGRVLAARNDAAKVARYLETKWIPVGQRESYAYLDILRVFKKGTNFRISVAFAENLSGAPTFEPLGIATANEENTFYFNRDAVYIKIRLDCNDPSANWVLSGLEVLGYGTGRRT